MGKSKSTLVIISRSTGEDTGVEYKVFLFMEEGLLFTSLMLKKAWLLRNHMPCQRKVRKLLSESKPHIWKPY